MEKQVENLILEQFNKTHYGKELNEVVNTLLLEVDSELPGLQIKHYQHTENIFPLEDTDGMYYDTLYIESNSYCGFIIFQTYNGYDLTPGQYTDIIYQLSDI